MKKVKIIQATMLNGAPVKTGTIVELDDGLAKNLILRNRAAEVKPPAKAAADTGTDPDGTATPAPAKASPAPVKPATPAPAK